jgi:hypothetical protein
MITPEKFREIWTGDEDQLVKYPANAVASLSILEEDKSFLVNAGLPDSAAPFLSFAVYCDTGLLVSASKHCNLPESFSCYRVIGFTGTGDPICIDESDKGSVVCLNHDKDFEKIFMSSSVIHFAEALLAYRHFVNETIKENGEDAYLDGDIPDGLKKWIVNEIQKIDAPSMDKGCFWRDNLDMY